MIIVHRCLNSEDMKNTMDSHVCASPMFETKYDNPDYIEVVCKGCGDVFKRPRKNKDEFISCSSVDGTLSWTVDEKLAFGNASVDCASLYDGSYIRFQQNGEKLGFGYVCSWKPTEEVRKKMIKRDKEVSEVFRSMFE